MGLVIEFSPAKREVRVRSPPMQQISCHRVAKFMNGVGCHRKSISRKSSSQITTRLRLRRNSVFRIFTKTLWTKLTGWFGRYIFSMYTLNSQRMTSYVFRVALVRQIESVKIVNSRVWKNLERHYLFDRFLQCIREHTRIKTFPVRSGSSLRHFRTGRLHIRLCL